MPHQLTRTRSPCHALLAEYGGDATLIGDEGGFAPPCDAREGVELVMEAIKTAGYEGKCEIGMDVAASEFKVEGTVAASCRLLTPSTRLASISQ